MKRVIRRWAAMLVASTLAVGIVTAGDLADPRGGDQLRPGPYLALQPAPYDGFIRFSQYVVVRDGTRIAVDIYRPTKHGVLASEKLPVVFSEDRYLRAVVFDGRLYTHLYQSPALFELLRHGYVIATCDVRGSGASFGVADGWFPPKEAEDAYDIIQWLAARPWSTGKVGMVGRSYLGITQYFAASEAPPALKAIIPESALFDSYDALYPGGIFGDWWVYSWSSMTQALDMSAPLPADWRAIASAQRSGQIDLAHARACFEMLSCPGFHGSVAPVDEDTDGQLLARATEAHKAAPSTMSIARRAIYRDSKINGEMVHLTRSPGLRRAGIAKSGIAVYNIGGWFDIFTRDTLRWYRNWPNKSNKLLIGPWYHDGTSNFDIAGEYLQWLDYWLKGIDNGITREPPITYFIMGAPPGHQWRTSWVWPPAKQKPTRFYFEPGRTGSVSSVNDGRLAAKPAARAVSWDPYIVNYTTTVGIDNRWTSAVGGGLGLPPYAHMKQNDEKGLTYTTPPLAAATEITGSPIVHLWLKCSSTDVDVFAYLEEVLPDGRSRYITEGMLRGSHRALAKAPFDNLGLPYHRSFAADIRPLVPGRLTELLFDLQPTSILFHAGDRIRITLTGADRDTFDTPTQSPAPTIWVERGGADGSYVVLPVIPQSQ
jgi:hypothetical protein